MNESSFFAPESRYRARLSRRQHTISFPCSYGKRMQRYTNTLLLFTAYITLVPPFLHHSIVAKCPISLFPLLFSFLFNGRFTIVDFLKKYIVHHLPPSEILDQLDSARRSKCYLPYSVTLSKISNTSPGFSATTYFHCGHKSAPCKFCQ